MLYMTFLEIFIKSFAHLIAAFVIEFMRFVTRMIYNIDMLA